MEQGKRKQPDATVKIMRAFQEMPAEERARVLDALIALYGERLK